MTDPRQMPTLQRGLPRIPSLIFDIEMELGDCTAVHPSEEIDDGTVVVELQNFLLPPSEEVQKLAEIVDTPSGSRLPSESVLDVQSLAEELTRQGYLVRVRRAVGGGEGSTCLHNLRHSFIICTGPDSKAPIVVDPSFSDQFQIAKPTERYAALLACVPSVLVIPEDRIVALVTFLSAELTLAFKVNGSVLPPWRQASSMLTKWQPRRSMDHAVTPKAQTQFHASAATMGNGTGGTEKRQMQQLHQEPQKAGKTTTEGFDSRSGWGIKIATPATARQIKPQAMEPTRVYGGFGAMNLIKG